MSSTAQLSLFDLAPVVVPVVDALPMELEAPSGPVAEPLLAWVATFGQSASRGCVAPLGGVRFAFYGRVSTAGFQDRSSSWRWRRDSATDLIRGRGRIVVEYFDVGCTRRQPWARRPQASHLLRAAARPDREFDAVVVGEADRAFCGTQLLSLAPLLAAHGVAVWLPEVGGPVDLAPIPTHRAVVLQIGSQAMREVQRTRFRTAAAMVAQAREPRRYLGGRPPYGDRLVDAGAHPNRVHATWGRRLHRLDLPPPPPPPTCSGSSSSCVRDGHLPGPPGR